MTTTPVDDDLPLLRDAHDLEAVAERSDDEGADDGAEDRALATRQRGAPDDHRRDRVELIAEAERGLGRVDARADQDAGEAREQAGQRVDGDLPGLDVDARQADRLLVAAQRERVSAERGPVEDEGRDDDGPEHDDRDVRDAEVARDVDPEQVAHDACVELGRVSSSRSVGSG